LRTPYRIDLAGKKVWRLTVLRYDHTDKVLGPCWLCLCDCGRETIKSGHSLRWGQTKSCGCLYVDTRRHASRKYPIGLGPLETPLYNVWKGMRRRCIVTPRYRDRGILVCAEWGDYLAFAEWAMANGYAPGLQIDRINNSGAYEPSNCRWVTCRENNLNTSRNHNITAFGETKPLGAWLADPRCKVGVNTLYSRIAEMGWDAEKAICTPARSNAKLDWEKVTGIRNSTETDEFLAVLYGVDRSTIGRIRRHESWRPSDAPLCDPNIATAPEAPL
jgi:hypothetical protein